MLRSLSKTRNCGSRWSRCSGLVKTLLPLLNDSGRDNIQSVLDAYIFLCLLVGERYPSESEDFVRRFRAVNGDSSPKCIDLKFLCRGRILPCGANLS